MPRDPFERPAGPSRPDFDTTAGRHDEPPPTTEADRMPDSDVHLSGQYFAAAQAEGSSAGLRLQIEQLLERREPAPVEEWRALGDAGLELLVSLLDDPALPDELRHTAIATLGRLGATGAVDRVGAVLLNRKESALTRTYAASALGRFGGDRAVVWLGRAVGDQSDMVRLQVVRSLRRVDTPAATAYLETLAQDEVEHVALQAKAALAGEVPARRQEPREGEGRRQPTPEER